MLITTRWIPVLLIAALLGGVDLALAAPDATTGDGWQVLEKHGRVRYRPVGDRYWWTARTGAEIPGGSSVAADGNGFLIIARAGESITVHPRSRLELPGGPSSDQVEQRAGDLRYRITRAPDRRFAVETPYLSLVVKGTVFDVAVGRADAEVDVAEGRVQVATPAGQAVDLTPGQSARISANAATGLEVRSTPEGTFAAAPAATRATAAGYTNDEAAGDIGGPSGDVVGQARGRAEGSPGNGRAGSGRGSGRGGGSGGPGGGGGARN